MQRILVVDDAPDMVEVLTFHLHRQGYEVLAAYGGQAALQMARDAAPELILMDVNMPDMDGMEVCRRLKADPARAQIPVILITCHDSDQAIADGLDAGADDYLTKPCSATVLAARVRAALRAKAAGDRLREANQALAKEVAARQRVEHVLSTLEEQHRQAQKLEAVGRLAGGVAHEFNNLLQAISGHTEYALRGLASDDSRYEDLQQVMIAARRASLLTRQLLGFSRRRPLRREPVDANRLVLDALALARPTLGERIVLELDLGEGLRMLDADAGELQQVLLNLCLNARDAMPTGDYAALARLPEPLRTKTELLKLAILIGWIAVGDWECWDRLEFPPGPVLRRLGIDALGEIIRATANDAEQIISFRPAAAPTPAGEFEKPKPPVRQLSYCNLSPEPFDFLGEIVTSMGIDLVPCEEESLPPGRQVLVNCIWSPPYRLAARVAHDGDDGSLLIVADAAHLAAYRRFGRVIPLPASHGALASACRDMAEIAAPVAV